MRFIVILILCLCLPLQSVGAVAMPFCEMGDMGSEKMSHQGTEDESMPMDHAGHDIEHISHHGNGDTGTHQALDCNECGLCHLACALALPSSTPVLSNVLKSVAQTAHPVNATSFEPAPIRKPPRGNLR